VHQIYAAAGASPTTPSLRDTSVAMEDAQRTTALITRHLSTMGVDPALWLHALETPPQDLYFLKPEEMVELKLATSLF
jgi:hypothetical protein